MKTIKIDDKKYKVECNALSYIFYKKIFNINIFDDINKIREYLIFQKNLSKKAILSNFEEATKKVQNFLDAIYRLTYICIYCKDKEIEDFDEWKNENNLLNSEENDWIGKIIQLVTDCYIDEEVEQELSKDSESNENEKVLFPEHTFLYTCLRIGLTMKDLENLTYVDVSKIFLSITKKRKTSKYRMATQADWDNLAASS